MYGFGDDRNPANDTVNVMEEILVEYITDIVCSSLCPHELLLIIGILVSGCLGPDQEDTPVC